MTLGGVLGEDGTTDTVSPFRFFAKNTTLLPHLLAGNVVFAGRLPRVGGLCGGMERETRVHAGVNPLVVSV